MMKYVERDVGKKLLRVIDRGKSVLLLGPRQTGKTTLVNHLESNASYSLADVRVRLRYEKNPALLVNEIEALAETMDQQPLITIDEIQKIPILMDVAQDLIDRKIAQFILTGSSVRKLRRSGEVNLLPGRVIPIYMDPLVVDEVPENPPNLKEWLLFGSLPEVVLTENADDKEEMLRSYITTYLEEEIRAEALVRNIGSFARFLEFAASESGYPINLAKLSQEVGVPHHTIASYYEILEDCLVMERIEPISRSKSRRKLIKAQKYLIFDLGIRRVAAREGARPPASYFGHLFEQFIGLQLIRLTRNELPKINICYWRDANGPEVDWVVDKGDEYIPIEVKWGESPTLKDARHLQLFLEEYDEAKQGYIVCQTPRKMKLAENIYAIPWQELSGLVGK